MPGNLNLRCDEDPGVWAANKHKQPDLFLMGADELTEWMSERCVVRRHPGKPQ